MSINSIQCHHLTRCPYCSSNTGIVYVIEFYIKRPFLSLKYGSEPDCSREGISDLLRPGESKGPSTESLDRDEDGRREFTHGQRCPQAGMVRAKAHVIHQEASRWDWLAPASRTSFRNHLIRHGMYGAGKWRRPAQQRARCIAEVFKIAVISCLARARQKASCSKAAAWSSSRGSSDSVMRELRRPWVIPGDFRRIQQPTAAKFAPSIDSDILAKRCKAFQQRAPLWAQHIIENHDTQPD